VFRVLTHPFPDLMAAAIERQDIALWAAHHDSATARGDG